MGSSPPGITSIATRAAALTLPTSAGVRKPSLSQFNAFCRKGSGEGSGGRNQSVIEPKVILFLLARTRDLDEKIKIPYRPALKPGHSSYLYDLASLFIFSSSRHAMVRPGLMGNGAEHLREALNKDEAEGAF